MAIVRKIIVDEDCDGCFTVWDNVSVVYGMGDKASEALAEYASAFDEYCKMREQDLTKREAK